MSILIPRYRFQHQRINIKNSLKNIKPVKFYTFTTINRVSCSNRETKAFKINRKKYPLWHNERTINICFALEPETSHQIYKSKTLARYLSIHSNIHFTKLSSTYIQKNLIHVRFFYFFYGICSYGITKQFSFRYDMVYIFYTDFYRVFFMVDNNFLLLLLLFGIRGCSRVFL